MPSLIPSPSIIESAGSKPKRIDEFVGRVDDGLARVRNGRMHSPGKWIEPGETPAFDEYT